MALSPAYASTPRLGTAQLSVANTARDGSGTLVTPFVAGANGSRVEAITVYALGTTTAGMVRIFVNDGTVSRLWTEIGVSAITPSAAVAAFGVTFTVDNYVLVLPPGYSIKASTEKGELINVFVVGGDF